MTGDINPGDVVYLSGPMSGLPNFNREAFFEAEKKLMKMGAIVINPAILPKGMEYKWYMDMAYDGIKVCDVFSQLENWRDSLGAIQERCWAYELEKRVVE